MSINHVKFIRGHIRETQWHEFTQGILRCIVRVVANPGILWLAAMGSARTGFTSSVWDSLNLNHQLVRGTANNACTRSRYSLSFYSYTWQTSDGLEGAWSETHSEVQGFECDRLEGSVETTSVWRSLRLHQKGTMLLTPAQTCFIANSLLPIGFTLQCIIQDPSKHTLKPFLCSMQIGPSEPVLPGQVSSDK
jgi:hypothetical protein